MKRSKLILALVCGFVAFSCNKNEQGINTGTQGDPTEVIINVKGAVTKATTVPGTEKETAIKTIEFYVFDAAGNPDTRVGKVGDTPGKGYIKFTTNVATKRVIVSSGTGKKFVALVNVNLGELAAGEKYADLKAKMATGEFKATSGGTDHNSRDENRSAGFEMEGETSADIVADKVDNKVSISVSRLVSRINAPTFVNGGNASPVNLKPEQIKALWGSTTTITNADLTFKFMGYALANGLSKSTTFFIGNAEEDKDKVDGDNKPVWNTWTWTNKNYLISDFNADGSYKNVYSGKFGADFFLDGLEANEGHRVYVYENKPDVITLEGQSGYDPKKVYAFIIKGELVVKDKPNENKIRYWRVDITRDQDYHVLRNQSYRINVNSIITPGEGTPKDAEEKPGIIPGKGESAADVSISVDDWELNISQTQM